MPRKRKLRGVVLYLYIYIVFLFFVLYMYMRMHVYEDVNVVYIMVFGARVTPTPSQLQMGKCRDLASVAPDTTTYSMREGVRAHQSLAVQGAGCSLTFRA